MEHAGVHCSLAVVRGHLRRVLVVNMAGQLPCRFLDHIRRRVQITLPQDVVTKLIALAGIVAELYHAILLIELHFLGRLVCGLLFEAFNASRLLLKFGYGCSQSHRILFIFAV